MIINRLKHIYGVCDREKEFLVSMARYATTIFIILFMFMGAVRLDAAQDVMSYGTNLRYDLKFTNSGMTLSLSNINPLVNDVIVTNYDYDVVNTNTGTPVLLFGHTNWYPMVLSNLGGVRSKPDTFFLTSTLSGTNGPGFQVLFSVAGTNVVTNSKVFHFLVGVTAPASGSNAVTVTAKIVSSTTNFTNAFNVGRITNTLTLQVVPPQASRFIIVHPGLAQVSNWASVLIKPVDSSSNAILNYRGTMTVDVSGGTGYVFWTNGNSGFTALPGGAQYKFAASDSGVVTLKVKDNIVQSLLIRVRGNGIFSFATNWLLFDKMEPYVVSMTPAASGYPNVTQIQDIQLLFNKPINPLTVTNVNFFVAKYDKDGASVNEALMLTTNNGGRGVRIHLLNASLSNDILTHYKITVTTNVRSLIGSYRLSQNPFNGNLYGAPFTNSLYTAIDKSISARVDQGLPGINVPLDMKIFIAPNALPVSAYMRMGQLDEGNAVVRDANDKVRLNQYLQTIPEHLGVEITGVDKTGSALRDINGATLVLLYEDTGGEVAGSKGNVSEDELNIFWLNESTGRWEYVGKPDIDKANNTVSIKIYKYGKYALMGDTTSRNFQESLIIYPNPFDPAKQQMNMRFFVEKPAYISAEIFTLTGEKVASLADRKYLDGGRVYESAIVWNGKNGRGMTVVNGVYIIKAKMEYVDGSGKQEKLYKVAVRK